MTDSDSLPDPSTNALAGLNYEQVHTLLDVSGIGTWDWDVETGIVLVNDKWAEMLGYTLEELGPVSAGTWLNLVHPEDLFRSNYELNAYWRGETELYELEYRIKHKYGHWLWVLDRGKALEWEGTGWPKRMVGTQVDITERKLDKIRLQRQQDMFEAMSEQGRIGAWEIDLTTDTVIWSTMAREIHEVEPDFIPRIDSGLSFYKEGGARDTMTRVIQEGIELGKPWDVESKIITAKGRECWVASTGSAEFLEGRCVRLYGSFQDIDKRKKSEAALLSAKQGAELASRTKGEFLAMMSHEIRTPLNGVLGMLSLLQSSVLDDSQTRKVDLARNSAESLLSAMNNILDYSKLDAGQLELKSYEFDIKKMLDQSLNDWAAKAHKKNLELVLDCVNLDARTIVGDEARIKQILENLVNNAIKFTSTGSVCIVVESYSSAFECELSFRVVDTGMGIPHVRLENLFEPFLHLAETNNSQSSRVGLGLALSKKLCTAMNGMISGRRLDSGGSEFTFSLRLHLGSPLAKYTDIASGEKVAIIEKSPRVSDMLKRQFEAWGANITVLTDSREMFEHTASTKLKPPYSFVLLRLDLDDGSAEAFSRRYKDASCMAGASLILISNTAERIDDSYLQRLGYALCLARPISSLDMSRLFDLVQSRQLNNINMQDQNKALLRVPPQHKILLVEDNMINQEVVLMMLDEIGLTADVADNGEQALNMLRQAEAHLPYTFVIMDCLMPVLDGYEATRQIRKGIAGKRYLNTPIVAMTANAMKGDREKCLDAGMSDYLSKPFDEKDLKAIVVRWRVASVSD